MIRNIWLYMIRNIWLYTKNCCSSRSRLFGNLINLKGLLVNMSLRRFSIRIERLSLQELKISLAHLWGSNMCNKITFMSRCYYRKLEANDITFLPEGLFDNLIKLYTLWVNTSLFSLSNKLKTLSPKEPRDQPEVIGRTQGLKTSNSED